MPYIHKRSIVSSRYAPDFGDTGTGFDMDTAAGGVWAVMTAFLLKRLVPGRIVDGFRILKSVKVKWLVLHCSYGRTISRGL